jgi:hypothetical protein
MVVCPVAEPMVVAFAPGEHRPRPGQAHRELRSALHLYKDGVIFSSVADPDPLVRGMDPVPAPDPSIIMQK